MPPTAHVLTEVPKALQVKASPFLPAGLLQVLISQQPLGRSGVNSLLTGEFGIFQTDATGGG